MIDLRNNVVGSGNKDQRRKICPVIPPVVYTKAIGEDGKTKPEIILIECFGEDCEIFCEIHGMCTWKCEHLEIIHGIASPDETDDTEGARG